MKKIILPVMLLLTAVLFLPSKADAQTRQECDKTRARASYDCLTERTKCIYSCKGDVSACNKACSQSNDVCEKQVEADYQVCLGTIKKDSENPPKTEVSSEAQSNTDCHGVFTKESNACLKESTECNNSCVDKGYAAMSLTVDGSKVYKECIRSVCDPASKACNDKAMANFRACQDARKTDKQPKTTKTQKQETKWLEFLGINPYQTWLRLQELAEVAQFYASGELEESLEGGFLNLFGSKSVRQKDEEAVKAKEQAFEAAFGKDWREQMQQVSQPKIEAKAETDAWNVPVSKDQPVIEIPGTTDTKRYSWDENSGVVIKSNDWEKIKFREPVEVDRMTSHIFELEQGAVEVKVKNDNPLENKFGVDAGWLEVTVSRTHFYVYKNPDKKSIAVIVYEGEVQVKTMGGKTVKVSPVDDMPGVVVVTQKLSPVKLTLAGLVVVAIVGGVIFIISKKKK